MRWILGVIVLANVALFMWGTWYHEPLVGTALPQPRPDVAQEKMKLLSEPGVRLVLRANGGPAAGDADSNVGKPGCYQLGPFAALDKARAASGKLDVWGLPYTRVAEFETLGPAYRVYLPPLPSKEAAERKRHELNNLGFTDHALIQEEGMENAVSVGMFAVERNAQARVEQLARKKIRALIQPIPNVRPVYWLTFPMPAADGKLGGIALENFNKEDWGASGVALRPTLCGLERAAQ